MSKIRAAAYSARNRAIRGWRAISPEYTNRVLDTVSLLAITRGVLYGLGPQPYDPVPRGLDLLPTWMLYTYGVMWLLAGLFGVVAARGHDMERQHWARRFIIMLSLVWATCYAAGALFPADGVTIKASLAACTLWLLVARLTYGACNEPAFKTLFIVHRHEEDGGPTFIVTKESATVEVVDREEGR